MNEYMQIKGSYVFLRDSLFFFKYLADYVEDVATTHRKCRYITSTILHVHVRAPQNDRVAETTEKRQAARRHETPRQNDPHPSHHLGAP